MASQSPPGRVGACIQPAPGLEQWLSASTAYNESLPQFYGYPSQPRLSPMAAQGQSGMEDAADHGAALAEPTNTSKKPPPKVPPPVPQTPAQLLNDVCAPNGYLAGPYTYMQPMSLQSTTPHPGPYIQNVYHMEDSCCSTGWVLFGVGFLFPICWLVGLFLPCCTKNKNDVRAAIGSGIMLVVDIIIVVIIVVWVFKLAQNVASAAAPTYRHYPY